MRGYFIYRSGIIDESLIFRTEYDSKRFWDKVMFTDYCWLWIACKNEQGYGKIGISNKRSRFAHRVAYVNCIGGIPMGFDVCHHCDNTSCINPAHLFVGTRKDNIRDMMDKGRRTNMQGSKHGMSKLKECEVEFIRMLISSSISMTLVSRMFKVSYQTIHRIYHRENWTHIP